MSRHRAQPPRRRSPASPHRHAAAAQPRYGRIGVVAVSATVCLVAMLGGFGVLPSVAGPSDRGGETDVARDLTGRTGGSGLAAIGDKAVLVLDSAQDEAAAGSADDSATAGAAGTAPVEEADPPEVDPSADETLPADSGDGYRVVFSEARQRVWLVDGDDEVVRTYPVSGSLYDNLDPGSYEVYSRSEQAYAFDGSGSMKYFVRFAQGDTGAAIGFHDIPVDNDGRLVQTRAQLGTPQSHGCIRQEREDAIALWEFTEIGTEVVVV
ncbi:L,D-transpeptidase [Nocardioides sp.]|uniref:L,D-transpeptidase n=1 Tax=Nocardioides sp. TaxID=35761 RepID=UPI001A1D6DE8|nr:L,D-transpeptidase [Nocardioides sp.]MBJ7358996.1 L,D-transpeptidase [Nocardioides sp.]